VISHYSSPAFFSFKVMFGDSIKISALQYIGPFLLNLRSSGSGAYDEYVISWKLPATVSVYIANLFYFSSLDFAFRFSGFLSPCQMGRQDVVQ